MPAIHVTAHTPHRGFTNGRTQPLLTRARDESGESHDVVLKVFSLAERGRHAAIAELLCSLIAPLLGIKVPQPFVVTVPDGFIECIAESEIAAKLRANPGPYFGSGYLPGAGAVPWQKSIPQDKRDSAAGIFTFDCLVQNSDRKEERPNLLENADEYIAIDHDSALADFSGMVIGGPVAPWLPAALSSSGFNFMNTHLFRRALKNRMDHCVIFGQSLSSLTYDQVTTAIDEIPLEWWPDDAYRQRLETYLTSAPSKSTETVGFAQTFLQP